MSLVLEGLSLVLEAGGLAIDCACCIKEKCEAIACLKDNDCDEAGKTPDAECFCRKKKCTDNPSCTGDEDCPEGLVCIDGECLSPCRGQSCADDEDCPEGCVCVDGGCFDPSKVFYCWGDANDPDADGSCRAGVPPPPPSDYTNKGGPYLSLGLCAMSGCKTKYECNPVVEDCFPSVTGTYGTLTECQSACGSDGDLGRCCRSTVTYDVNGDVTKVEQDCADCCNGEKVPVDPDNPGLGTKCENTNACRKSQCISDGPISFPGTRTFRQFNSLFDNCDECPTSPLGPCCFEDDNPESATFGQSICDETDKFYCTEFLNGDWKGLTWWTCTDERVDTGREFACPACNGKGDCACDGDAYCYNQKCNDCIRNAPVQTGDYTTIDDNPKVGDRWKFRSRDCFNGVSTQEEAIEIYGELNDGTYELLITVDNSDVNSAGQTEWTNTSNGNVDTGCYFRLVAKKMFGDPDLAELCYEKIPAGDPRPPDGCEPIEVGWEGECECPGSTNCSPDDDNLAYATYLWSEYRNQLPAGLILLDGACRDNYTTQWWVESTEQNLEIPTGTTDEFGFPCFQSKSSGFQYIRLLAYLPGAGWTDVTDDWVDSTTNADPATGFDDLLRSEYYTEDEAPFDPITCDPNSFIVESGSSGVYQELYDVGCEKPDPLANCDDVKFRSENPLP